MYRFIQDCFTAFMEASGIDFEVAGADNIPLKGGFVLYPNHQSFLDIPAVVLGCPRPIAAVMKKELASMPVVKQLAAATGSHCLDREDDKQAIKVIRDVSAEVKAGRGTWSFPKERGAEPVSFSISRPEASNASPEQNAPSFPLRSKVRATRSQAQVVRLGASEPISWNRSHSSITNR
mgnify:CR=1 FL=1